jgi:hypothetical protein
MHLVLILFSSGYKEKMVYVIASDWELREIMAANTRYSEFSHNFTPRMPT